MCNFNIICQVKDGSCSCKKSSLFPEIIKPIPIPCVLTTDASLFGNFTRIIAQQNEAMKSILEQTKDILEKITNISQRPSSFISNPSSGDEPATSSQLQKFLCGENPEHTFSLQLINEVTNPAYKERPFSLLIQIIDANGNKAILKENLNFSIKIFTMENPPKLLKVSTSGDKILKGTIDIQGNSSLIFSKIIIREVSSHFRNGCFFLVVSPNDCNYIKPLIVNDLVVKARKMINDGIPKKNFKLQEADKN